MTSIQKDSASYGYSPEIACAAYILEVNMIAPFGTPSGIPVIRFNWLKWFNQVAINVHARGIQDFRVSEYRDLETSEMFMLSAHPGIADYVQQRWKALMPKLEKDGELFNSNTQGSHRTGRILTAAIDAGVNHCSFINSPQMIRYKPGDQSMIVGCDFSTLTLEKLCDYVAEIP